MGFRISEALSKEFKSVCALQGTTVKDVLTNAIKEYLAKVRIKKPD
ncbi:MAG: hypothetical protein IJG34_06380 [Synergistaceae bacterium]|nr:hypothetical protein [Synergistaceae bacterium]MBQ3449502.1 hypothetical protein [Synergistaceae bacterium]MBR0251143.1 hypothetical protein [Synergistaceae bacterium]